MLVWKIGKDGKACEIFNGCPTTWEACHQNRNDLYNFGQAQQVASELTEATGDLYIPTDTGGDYLPRYDVVKAPVVGAPVSYTYNGDYYPCGHIISVSKTFKVVTAKDQRGNTHRFYRRGLRGAWIMDGMWSMVHGHIERSNPHF